jgi:acyl-CoA synthetase (AMP-forming)/AMP-acid ligase II
MDRFGDNLYNLYGSTEVGWATIATPEDLRVDPSTAGRPPINARIRIVDDEGADVPTGTSGRIFVGSPLLFDGYTNGGSKEMLDGFMSTGDTGRLDEAGRLRVEGRSDDMIVSGGENVYPREVEELIERMPGVNEAVVVGVPDEEFGQRLVAHVVPADDGTAPTAEGVRAHVMSNLARYKVPRDVLFIDELPRNATGKVLRDRL